MPRIISTATTITKPNAKTVLDIFFLEYSHYSCCMKTNLLLKLSIESRLLYVKIAIDKVQSIFSCTKFVNCLKVTTNYVFVQ